MLSFSLAPVPAAACASHSLHRSLLHKERLIRPQHQILVHHHVDLKPRAYRQRRLDAEVAARDFLADLIGRVLRAVAQRNDRIAVGAALVRDGQLGADAEHCGQRGTHKNTTPMPVHAVLQARITGRVDALHRARGLTATIRGTGGQAAFDEVFLRAVEHAPQVAAAVVVTARQQDLRFRDGHGRRLVVLQRRRRAGEYFRLAAVQRDRLHGIAGCLRAVEAVQDFVSAFDDVPGHVALVGYAHVRHGVAADKAIAAHEPEHAGEHLIAARSIMGIEEDDFVGFASVDLADMAQANHVFGVVAAVVLPPAGLAHHERLEAFAAKFLQHRGGGDVAVSLRAAFVRGVREDGRGYGSDLVIKQGTFRTQHRRTGSEAGCELHGISPDKEKGVCCSHRTPDS